MFYLSYKKYQSSILKSFTLKLSQTLPINFSTFHVYLYNPFHDFKEKNVNPSNLEEYSLPFASIPLSYIQNYESLFLKGNFDYNTYYKNNEITLTFQPNKNFSEASNKILTQKYVTLFLMSSSVDSSNQVELQIIGHFYLELNPNASEIFSNPSNYNVVTESFVSITPSPSPLNTNIQFLPTYSSSPTFTDSEGASIYSNSARSSYNSSFDFSNSEGSNPSFQVNLFPETSKKRSISHLEESEVINMKCDPSTYSFNTPFTPYFKNTKNIDMTNKKFKIKKNIIESSSSPTDSPIPTNSKFGPMDAYKSYQETLQMDTNNSSSLIILPKKEKSKNMAFLNPKRQVPKHRIKPNNESELTAPPVILDAFELDTPDELSSNPYNTQYAYNMNNINGYYYPQGQSSECLTLDTNDGEMEFEEISSIFLDEDNNRKEFETPEERAAKNYYKNFDLNFNQHLFNDQTIILPSRKC